MGETIYAEQYLEYQTKRSALRKAIRKIYLWHVRHHVVGHVLDFGCGAGEHLRTFSKESLGLEVNEATVKYGLSQGLNVQRYDPDQDDYALREIPVGKFQTLVISHVLEHLNNPAEVLRKLMAACERIGIKRIFICVPCEVGFAHDKTHVTFITMDYIQQNYLESCGAFRLIKKGYFPFNFRLVGKLFVYNELYLMYEHP